MGRKARTTKARLGRLLPSWAQKLSRRRREELEDLFCSAMGDVEKECAVEVEEVRARLDEVRKTVGAVVEHATAREVAHCTEALSRAIANAEAEVRATTSGELIVASYNEGYEKAVRDLAECVPSTQAYLLQQGYIEVDEPQQSDGRWPPVRVVGPLVVPGPDGRLGLARDPKPDHDDVVRRRE